MRSLAICVALMVLAASQAVAQIGNPGGMTAATPQSEPGKPAPHQPNAQDRLFYVLASTGGIAEVEAAKLAEKKASSAVVKEFARRMTQDHAKANTQLASLAKASRVPLPEAPSPDHKAQLAELERLSGAAFDLTFMRQQLVEHQKISNLLQWEISSGQDGDLQRYAMESLPNTLEHLEMAQMIIAKLTGADPQGLAATAGPKIANTSESNRPVYSSGR